MHFLKFDCTRLHLCSEPVTRAQARRARSDRWIASDKWSILTDIARYPGCGIDLAISC
jgi:hypothetical protein